MGLILSNSPTAQAFGGGGSSSNRSDLSPLLLGIEWSNGSWGLVCAQGSD